MSEKQIKLIAVCICRDENGRKHKPGEEFSCNDKLAQTLNLNGSAAFASESLPPDTIKPADTGSKDDDTGAKDGPQTIAEAIEFLLKQDPEKNSETFWKKDGAPKVKAVENILKKDVSAANVDEAWEEFESNG